MKVDFFRHSIDDEDIQRAVEVLRSLFLTTGDQVEQFEAALADYVGTPKAYGLTSCTAAIHLSLRSWDVGPGAEVITTPLSFVGTASAIQHAGATPVFADVDAKTGILDPDKVEAAINARTRAIVPVHLYGQMCDMRALRQLADAHGLILVEDCAHCLEGVRDGIRPAMLSEAACFSFHAIKNITSGEGGAVATRFADKGEDIRRLRMHGLFYTDTPPAGGVPGRDTEVLGWKFNMDNIRGALLHGQLMRAEALLARRQALAGMYEEGLAGHPEIDLVPVLPGTRHARNLFPVLVPAARRDAVIAELAARGVETGVFFPPIHLFTYYRRRFGYTDGDFPKAEAFSQRVICLPLYPRLQDQEARYVIDTLRQVLGEP